MLYEKANFPSATGRGDMLQSVYDTNGDGIVNGADSVPWSGITDKPELYTKSEVDDLLENVEIDVDSALSDTSENPVQNKVVKAAVDGKVDKVSGKGLSTNDYTTAEKNKLSGIEAGAEVNVNADLNATSGDAQILNNPFSIVNGMLMVTYTA
jgi:hypothetical protein